MAGGQYSERRRSQRGQIDAFVARQLAQRRVLSVAQREKLPEEYFVFIYI